MPTKSRQQILDEHAPWKPPEYEAADAVAVQALANGIASGEQQKRALKWIIERAAATYDWAYRPDNERDTHIALGRQFVGHQIVKLTKIKVGQLK